MNNLAKCIEDMPIGALFNVISKNQFKYLNRKLAKYDINLIQGVFLIKISYFSNLSQEDLARMFILSKGNVAKSIKKLEDKNYLIREINKEDKRKYILKITDEGEKIIPIIKDNIHEWENIMGFNSISKDFYNTLIKCTFKSVELNKE